MKGTAMTKFAASASLTILASLAAATPALADSMRLNCSDVGKTVTLDYMAIRAAAAPPSTA
jgi:hypothetical protein